MRVGIISDIHGNRTALEAVLADLRTRAVDALYSLGDLVGYAAHPNEVTRSCAVSAQMPLASCEGCSGRFPRWFVKNAALTSADRHPIELSAELPGCVATLMRRSIHYDHGKAYHAGRIRQCVFRGCERGV